MLPMKTATVRDVQHHFRKVLAWVENGEEVLVTRRNKTVARLIPSSSFVPTSVPLPDFAARARAIWGAQPKQPKGVSLSAKRAGLSAAILAQREEQR